MAMRRKGMGKGRGSGYRNMIGSDPKVHDDSRQGRKQPQRLIVAPPFKSANKLPVQVGLIVPSTKKDKAISQVDFDARVESEKTWFSKRFGGDTSVRQVGSYYDGKKLIKEPGAMVQSSMTAKKYNEKRRLLADHVMRRRKQWEQDSMLMRVEGQDFIVPKRKFIDDDKGQDKFIPVS